MMGKKAVLSLFLAVIVAASVSYSNNVSQNISVSLDSIRALYSKPVSEWPAPHIDSGVVWEEFKALNRTTMDGARMASEPQVILGKLLFFDPILSGSNQISCSTCHNPQTSWADHLTVSVGSDHKEGERNTISLLNVYARKKLFWDGRATSLEEQALGPIEAHHEMNMDLTKLVPKLKAIPAYRELFKDVYGDENFSMPEILEALAAFQRTLYSRRTRFDDFLEGKYSALNDQEIYGLHLFRTKARCMNCHYGEFFTDELFHNIGLTYYKRGKYEDWGLYEVTKNPEDIGKFRTPMLRDVMNTGPWMHNGLFGDMTGLLNMYNSGMQMNNPTAEEKAVDPLHPVVDPLMKPLNLTKGEIAAVEAFLHSITGAKYRMSRPEKLPR